MNATIIGAQLGDEGKGAIVDLFGEHADVVVRYQGGANAGHSVVADGEEYHLRLVPSGVVRGSEAAIGPGCVVSVNALFEELAVLRSRGIDPTIHVDPRAHVVMPYHRVLDDAEEASRSDAVTVGTTGNGIGPAYEDKAGRRGVRVGDLLDPETLRVRLEAAVPEKRRHATAVHGVDADEAFDVGHLFERFRAYGTQLDDAVNVADVGALLEERARAGDGILFESAQGTYLDVDHGNYPFVTSSNPTAGGAVVGAGVAPAVVGDGAVVGVLKAYLSRVGAGPMPTELDEAAVSGFREHVGAFGTNTGRSRRIGWLDLPMARYAARVNGFTGIALNHVDALAWFDEVKVCTAYELEGERRETVPPTTREWERCSPIYETLDSWPDVDWERVAAAGEDALPAASREFVEFVGDALECPIYAIGVGPARGETIVRENPLASNGDPPKHSRPVSEMT